jgi:ABC-type lipoprotein export system ATPase subunit
MPQIVVENLTKTYRVAERTAGLAGAIAGLVRRRHRVVRALDGMTVAFEEGRFSAIMGPSGSGKSTLLHCIAGLDSLTSGSAYIGDVRLGDLDDRRLTLLRRKKVGFVFQAFNLIPTLDAAENITLPIDIAGEKVDRPWFDTVVDTMSLRDRLTHRPAELSGGQVQRPDDPNGHRDLDERPALFVVDDDAADIALADQFLDLGEQLLALHPELIHAALVTLIGHLGLLVGSPRQSIRRRREDGRGGPELGTGRGPGRPRSARLSGRRDSSPPQG